MKGSRCLGPLVVVAFLIARCSTGSTGTRPAASPQHVKVSAENSNFEWFFLLMDVAQQEGLWAKHRLDPELVPTAASAEQLRARVESGIKLGLVNTAEVLLARAKGVPVKIVAGYFGPTSAKLYVKADGPIRTPKDLDGRRVGILATTHTSYRTISYMNAKLGLKTEPVPLGNLANNLAALRSGKVDAFYSAEGAALPFLDSGELRLLLPFADIYPKPYTAVVAWATDDLIRDNPDVVRAFVQVTLEAVKYLRENPTQAAELLTRRTNAPKDVASRIVAELNKVLTPTGRGSEQDLVAAVGGSWRFTVESGAVSAGTQVNVNDCTDERFLP